MNRNISNRVKGWSNTTLFAWRMTTLMKRDITLSLSFSWKSTHWENFFFDCANYTMPRIVVLALTYRRKYERIIVNYYFWFFFCVVIVHSPRKLFVCHIFIPHRGLQFLFSPLIWGAKKQTFTVGVIKKNLQSKLTVKYTVTTISIFWKNRCMWN